MTHQSRPESNVSKRGIVPLPLRPEVDLSIVVPVFNESELLESFLESWQAELNECGVSYEWVMINDGSTDGTGRLLDKLRKENSKIRVTHQLNSGHGRAVRRGYELARGRYVLQLDANGRYEPGDFKPLWDRHESASLVLAHRTHRLDNFFRRVVSAMLRKTANTLFGLKLEDPNVPLRLFKRSLVDSHLSFLPRDWESVNLALSMLVARESPREVAEVKVPFRRRAKGDSRIGMFALLELGSRYLSELFRLRFKIMSRIITEPTAQASLTEQAAT